MTRASAVWRHAHFTTACVAALVIATPAVARAHATLVSSDPAAGSTVASTPRRVRLVFDEPIDVSLARITLVIGGGRTIELRSTGDPHDVYALVAPIDSLESGTYRVIWRVVSADGHLVGGNYEFTVGTSRPVTASGPPLPLPDEHDLAAAAGVGPVVGGVPIIAAILRGAALGCLMTLAGLLFFLTTSHAAPSGPVGRVVLGLALIEPMLLGGHLLTWLLDTAPDHHVDMAWAQSALATNTGIAELATGACSLLALWALWLARRPVLALAFAGIGLVFSTAVGHALAIRPAWTMPTKALHLFAVAAWLGGLVWLLLTDRSDSDAYLRDVACVSTIALCAVTVVLATGIAETFLVVPSISALARSAYGAVVLAKVAGVAVLVAFGAYHRTRGIPRLRAGIGTLAFRRSVRREAVVMAVVVLLGGWLAYVPPPSGGRSSSSRTVLPSTVESPQ